MISCTFRSNQNHKSNTKSITHQTTAKHPYSNLHEKLNQIENCLLSFPEHVSYFMVQFPKG